MAALAKGYRVVVLFDASGVTLVRRGGLFGGDRTPLDKARLPERERRTLAAQFGLAPGDVPRDYGAYFHELARRGVRLVANRTMMLLYKIGEDEIDPGVKPVSLSEMAALFAQADVYVAY
nr:DsrE family protein [Dissulfurirhabdus thermomarina]